MEILKSLQSALLVMMLIINIIVASPTEQCGNEYGQKPCIFLPAKPGHTPKCAKPGSTFCEHVDDYPESLIQKLLKNFAASRDILADEKKIDFEASKEVTYGKANHHGNDFYGPIFDHFNNNFKNSYHDNYHRPQQENGTPNISGYHYPRPGASSHSFFQVKPPSPSSSSSSSSSYYRRPTRQISNFYATEGETQEAREINFSTRFLNAIAPSNRTRRQISADREQLCQVRSNYINPQAALNVRGNWMFIVNGGEMATQLVRTEICVSSQCSNLCQLPNGYNSRCEQKYVQKRLLSLSPGGERLLTDTFWFPSCCVCTLSNS